jgi:phage FluMu protein Com
MKQYRCPNCHKLLFYADYFIGEIQCPRCKIKVKKEKDKELVALIEKVINTLVSP